jgi:four helix bundle protein
MGRFNGDLPERTYQFARVVVRLVRQCPNCTEGWGIAKQLMKSGTSIAANVCEADAALTDREFISFCNIARRESLETRMWLRLARDEGVLTQELVETPLAEVEEIGRILTTIIRKTRSE